MALRTSLVIAGDASGAEAALGATNEGLQQTGTQAEATAKAFANADVAITRLGVAQAQAKRETEASRAAFAAGELTLEQYNRQLVETKSALSLVEGEHRKAMTVLRDAKSAGDANTVSLGQQRAGYTNFGRQVQDVAVMLQGGANIGTIISTQAGQMADAVSQMGGRMAGFASFLAGPWGTAVILGVSVLVDQLIPALFDTGDAQDEAKGKAYDFADGLNVIQLSARNTISVLQQLSTEMRSAIAVQGDFLRSKSLLAGQAVADIEKRLADNQREYDGIRAQMGTLASAIPFNGPNYRRAGQLREEIKLDREALAIAREAAADSSIAAAQSRALEDLDAKTAATGRYNRAVAELNKNLRDSVEDPIGAQLGGRYLSEAEYQKRFRDLTARKDADLEALKPEKKDRTAERAAARAARLQEFGEDTAGKIAGIRDQFSDLPSQVVRSNKALRDLDDIASDLERRRPPNYASLKPALEEARRAVQDSLLRPFNDYLKKAEQAAQIDQLLAAGREDEAAALQVVLSLQDKMNPLTEEQLDTVLETVRAERQRSMVLRDQQALIQANVNAVHDMRGALEQTVSDMLRGRFSVKNILSSLGDSYLRITSQRIVESMFGDTLRALEDRASGQQYVEKAGKGMAEELKKASAAVLDWRSAVERSTIGAAQSAPSSGATPAPSAPSSDGSAQPSEGEEGGEITVTARRPNGNFVVEILNQVMRPLGVELPKKLTDLLSSFLGKLEVSLPDVMKGALTGATASKLILGSGGSGIGGAIGGAIGEKVGEKFMSKGLETLAKGLGDFAGPLGSIAGGLIGGVLGGLFKKAKWGTSVVSGQGDDDVSTSGNKAAYRANSSGVAGTVQDMIAQIAEQLGGDPSGGYNVSIGQYKGKWRVSNTGRTGKLKGKYSDVTDFGEDGAEAAALYAALDAISDGAIKGISAAVQKALKSSDDLEKAVAEALKVQEVEMLVGGLGAELEKAFKDFERQAQERLRIAKDYGFDIVAIEQRNAEDRLKLSEQLLEQQVGSLQKLIDEMTSGALFEGSAVEQRDALLAEIEKTRAAANAGEDGAADKLAGLLEQLNAVSRDAYGTTGGFADDRELILDAARDAITKANQRIADAQKGSDPALATTNATLDEMADQNAQMLNEQKTTNTLLAKFFASGGKVSLADLMAQARTS